jgi:hypothetical protein
MTLDIILVKQFPKQAIHFFERLAFGFRIPDDHDDHAGGVDGEEDEVSLGANVLNTDGEELPNDNGADGAGGGADVDAFGADVGWEDLWRKVSMSIKLSWIKLSGEGMEKGHTSVP